MLKTIKYIVFLAIGLGLAWYASKDADVDTIWNAATQLNWFWAFLSMVLSYVAMIIRGYRWNILLEPMGYHARNSNNVHAVAFGYMMNDLIPRSGELARCALLSRAEDIPVDKLVGTVILERIVDMLTLLLVIGLATWLQADAIHALWDQITAAKAGQPTTEKSYTLYYVLIALIILGFLGWWILGKLQHIAFFAKIKNFADGIFDGVKSILKLREKNKFILLTLGIWAAWLLMAYYMMKALPATSSLTLADALFFMVAGSFGMIVPTQGGLGAYHLTSKYGFIALGLDGALGLTFAWISWVGKTIVEFIVGAIGFVIVDQRSKRNSNAKTS
ncbi:MAG: hypothetical protein RL062_331 [Bacteroidota bacterium]|jgi:uncharacterized protein (TIRG00374 family)